MKIIENRIYEASNKSDGFPNFSKPTLAKEA